MLSFEFLDNTLTARNCMRKFKIVHSRPDIVVKTALKRNFDYFQQIFDLDSKESIIRSRRTSWTKSKSYETKSLSIIPK